jgi:hypothetical protein
MRVLKLFTGFAGMIAILVGIPSLIVGIVLFAASADGDRTELPTFSVVSNGRALHADDLDHVHRHDDDSWFITQVGDISVTASDEVLFAGIGPTDEVRSFLLGTGRPGAETFWIDRSEGTTVDLVWEARAGDWSAVVMNADGTRGVDATFDVSIPSGPVRLVAWLVTTVATGILVTGVVLIWVGWRGDRRTREPQPPVAA